VITVKPVTHNAFTPLRHGDNYGWAHACGFFVYSPAEPLTCMECRSAFRNDLANHGAWHLTYISKGAPS
jgi:hypothetical protein